MAALESSGKGRDPLRAETPRRPPRTPSTSGRRTSSPFSSSASSTTDKWRRSGSATGNAILDDTLVGLQEVSDLLQESLTQLKTNHADNEDKNNFKELGSRQAPKMMATKKGLMPHTSSSPAALGDRRTARRSEGPRSTWTARSEEYYKTSVEDKMSDYEDVWCDTLPAKRRILMAIERERRAAAEVPVLRSKTLVENEVEAHFATLVGRDTKKKLNKNTKEDNETMYGVPFGLRSVESSLSDRVRAEIMLRACDNSSNRSRSLVLLPEESELSDAHMPMVTKSLRRTRRKSRRSSQGTQDQSSAWHAHCSSWEYLADYEQVEESTGKKKDKVDNRVKMESEEKLVSSSSSSSLTSTQVSSDESTSLSVILSRGLALETKDEVTSSKEKNKDNADQEYNDTMDSAIGLMAEEDAANCCRQPEDSSHRDSVLKETRLEWISSPINSNGSNKQNRHRDAQATNKDAEAKTRDSEATIKDAEAKNEDTKAKNEDAEAKNEDAEAKNEDAEAKDVVHPEDLEAEVEVQSQADVRVRLQCRIRGLCDDCNLFGLIVKAFIECTETSKERSPHTVMRNIRQFISGLKHFLVKGELREALKQEQEKLSEDEFVSLDPVLEEVLHELVVDPLSSHLTDLFLSDLKGNGSLRLLATQIQRLRRELRKRNVFDVSQSCLDIVDKCDILMDTLAESTSAVVKLDVFLKVLRTISETVVPDETESQRREELSMSSITNALAHVLVTCDCRRIELESEWMWGLCPQALLTGDTFYALSLLSSTIVMLKNVAMEEEREEAMHSRAASVLSSGTVMSGEEAGTSSGAVLNVINVHSMDKRHLRVPIRPTSSVKETRSLIAHRLRITNAEDFILAALKDGRETELSDTDQPYVIEMDAFRASLSISFVFRRRDATILWPTIRRKKMDNLVNTT